MSRPSSFLQKLESLWQDTAGLISYHHADDTAKEWGQAEALRPLLLELERQIKAYGGARPTGEFLLDRSFRIDWGAS